MNMNKIVCDEKMIKHFISILGSHRFKLHHFWIDIGKALYNTYKGTLEGFKLWFNSTQLIKHIQSYDAGQVYRLYTEFSTNNHLTYKTLAWYAMEDSPEAFNKWHEEWINDALEQATSRDHADVAEALYRCYFLEFITGSVSDNKHIYQFKNNKWKKIDNGYILTSYMTTDFLSKFEKLRVKIATNYDSEDISEAQIRQISKLIKKLKSRSFGQQILLKSLEQFYVEDLEQKIDSNLNLMGMINGVIEMGKDEVIFRSRKPEDFISKSTGIMWNQDLHWEHTHVKKLIKYFEDIFPDKELLEYFMKCMASCLISEKLDSYIWEGQRDYSKSTVKRLIENTFGEYCLNLSKPLSTLNKMEIKQLQETKICWIQESTLKNLNKELRVYFDENISCKLFSDCTHNPIINVNSAISRHIHFIPFSSKIDKEFEYTSDEFASAFLWYIVQIFPMFRNEKLNKPRSIEEYTQKYWDEHDIYVQFKDEILEVSDKINTSEMIQINNIYNTFRYWFKENYDFTEIPDKFLFITQMSRLLGEPLKNAWTGLKVTVADI